MRTLFWVAAAVLLIFALMFVLKSAVRAAFPRPYRRTVLQSGLDETLVYAVMKAESGFREDAVSSAGAVGLMQLMPATAEYICMLSGVPYEAERLTEGEYNASLGCSYLSYLFARFECEETALCAYNAGEGTVREWLKNADYSRDGKFLEKIPFAETAEYVKKVGHYKRFYQALY